ncbi:MAG: G5-linked-Ubiquitin-like domain, partial [Clostridia bacterium]|nr:G5-linked-Ubiquitin-like domain [Clostridia bacterium]
MTNRRYFSSIFIILLLLGTFIWFLSFSKIRINIDDKTIEYWTRGKTVEAVLKELNLTLKQNEIVYPSLNTSMTDINQIDIKRGHKVTLEVDGQIE